jgi:sulfur-oxidizing protein SoxA
MKSTIAALCALFAAAAFAQDLRRSGFDDMGPATQAMQRDDLQNPGMLWVQDGAALWAKPPGNGQPACSGCHASTAMRGVAARHPAFDAVLQRPVHLAQRLNLCRERQQKHPPFAYESPELLALEAFVAHQSRGLPVAPADDPRLQPYRARGEALYRQRLGQLDLSCAQCHDERAGLRLGGNRIPQGHANGYPLYRLEWQSLGSLQRRLRNCLTGVRAEPSAYGDMALIELELYLAKRAQGLAIEAPAVRP